ncbi:DEAD-box type RNA helicase [Thoreauomyces humboldtii]|nr:DEAD-box type RNA helicase [Thoreauomyces humboldtii]
MGSRFVGKGVAAQKSKPFRFCVYPKTKIEDFHLHADLLIQNLKEAMTVVSLIINQFLQREFLVVTPYNAQRMLISDLLRQAIRKRNARGINDVKDDLADRCIMTIDTVQGQDSDVIIFSAVRTFQPGFLTNKRRMNVALTRAKDRLVVVADLKLFRTGFGKNSLLGDFVRHMENEVDVVDGEKVRAGRALSWKRKQMVADQQGSQQRKPPHAVDVLTSRMAGLAVTPKIKVPKLLEAAANGGILPEPGDGGQLGIKMMKKRKKTKNQRAAARRRKSLANELQR